MDPISSFHRLKRLFAEQNVWLVLALTFVAGLLSYLLSADSSTDFLNAVVGGGFGAFFGAVAAQRIAESTRRSAEIRHELTLTNSAMAQIATVFVRAEFTLRDRVQQLHDDTSAQAERRHRLFQLNRAGIPTFPRHEGIDLTEIIDQKYPLQRIEEFVLEKLAVTGVALGAATFAREAADNFSVFATVRSSYIKAASQLADEPDSRDVYLDRLVGLPVNRSIDDGFVVATQGLAENLEAIIAYTRILYAELHAHAKELASDPAATFAGKPLQIQNFDFGPYEAAGRIQRLAQYRSWIVGNPEPIQRREETWEPPKFD